jgi:small subunit ribosomal protein S2
MTPVVTMRQLLESGVHFGHQTRRWNPKMKRFIFTERNGIYIIDLRQSLDYIDRAYEFIRETVAHGGTILYVGTKKQAQEAIAEQARRVGMPFVNQRWLGGMLTNFGTVFKRLQRLKELEEVDFTDVAGSTLTKKELLHLKREHDKLDRSLGGIRHMTRVPSAVWVVDTKKEHIAVSEARKLGIPVIAILDTNCDPDEVTYPIPGNDDAIRSVSLLTRVIADAVADGLIARAGQGADGDAKPSAELGAGEIGTAEPLAEWERELVGGSRTGEATTASANGTANGTVLHTEVPASTGDAPAASADAAPQAPITAEATTAEATTAEATTAEAAPAEAVTEAPAETAAPAEATTTEAAPAEAAPAEATTTEATTTEATTTEATTTEATTTEAATEAPAETAAAATTEAPVEATAEATPEA